MPHSTRSSRQDPGAPLSFSPLTATAHSSRKVLSCHCSFLSESLEKKTKTNKAKQTNTATRTGDTGVGSSRASRGRAAFSMPGGHRSPALPLPKCVPAPRTAAQPPGAPGRSHRRTPRRSRPGKVRPGRLGTRSRYRAQAICPEPAALWAALPRSRPCLTRRLALSPAALAMR